MGRITDFMKASAGSRGRRENALTVRLGDGENARLEGLANRMGMSRTGLANRLLEMAIEEAFDAMKPTFPGPPITDRPTPTEPTQADTIKDAPRLPSAAEESGYGMPKIKEFKGKAK